MTLLRRFVALLVPVTFAIGASGCATTSNEAVGESDLTGEHFPASNCELFVDRAAPHFDSHGVSALTIYLKTPLDKVSGRGGVKSVGYHAQTISDGKPGPFADMVARPFASASDYWELHFTMASDFSPTESFVGAFYVETGDGTRLWVNAGDGHANFVLDGNMIGNMEHLRAPGFFAATGSSSPPSAIVVASEFPYLNSRGCR